MYNSYISHKIYPFFGPNQDYADSYLPAFRACVERGKASSIMCSYNSINGVPSCANKELLTDVARGVWDFDGYITGDCAAVNKERKSRLYETKEEKADYMKFYIFVMNRKHGPIGFYWCRTEIPN